MYNWITPPPSSDEWNGVSEEEREAMGLVYEDDGEFWSVQCILCVFLLRTPSLPPFLAPLPLPPLSPSLSD